MANNNIEVTFEIMEHVGVIEKTEYLMEINIEITEHLSIINLEQAEYLTYNNHEEKELNYK